MPLKFLQVSVCPILCFLIIISCKKAIPAPPPVPTPPIVVVPPAGDSTVVPGADPVTASTIGFFLDNWKAKTFAAPDYADATIPTDAANTVTVDATSIITKIPVTIFGHNTVMWMGPVASQPNFINPINNLQPHILRFPGGSASDAYFWNAAQGVLPADVPVKLLDASGNQKDPGYNYGKTNYNWQSNLDDYYSMLQQTNNKGIITINYGYARYGTSANPVATAAHLAADWVRYDNGRTQLWEIGNENFGDWEWGFRIDQSANMDGQPQYLTGALYAQHFKVFVDSMQKAAAEIGNKINIGAVTVEAPSQSWQTNTTQTWNAGMMPGINNKADFFVVHNYFTPYNQNSTAGVVLGAALSVPSTMMNYVTQTLQGYGATPKPVVMDEWNMFATGSKQQVSNTSGVFATLVMGEAIKNKYGMAARWDVINGWGNGDDHGLFSAGDEPGIAKWSPRPSFYYLYYFQKMLGDRMVNTSTQGSTDITAYASTYTSGQVNVTLVNSSANPQAVAVKMKNFYAGNRFYWYSLEGSTDNGEFSRKVLVNGNGPSTEAGGPPSYVTLKAQSAVTTNGIKVTVPALGVVIIAVDKK